MQMSVRVNKIYLAKNFTHYNDGRAFFCDLFTNILCHFINTFQSKPKDRIGVFDR